MRWMLPIAGLASLIWFLVRVVPKPSRAAYPCQRAAAPLASSFVVWLLGVSASVWAGKKANRCLSRSNFVVAGFFVLLATGVMWLVFDVASNRSVQADLAVSNAPVGDAKGVFPGRVVWAHDPDATDWEGPGDGHWWESHHTDQGVVNKMMDQAIQTLAGQHESAAAWEKLFRHFNQTHGRGDIGYQAGEKIMVKVNFVGCIAGRRGQEVARIEDYDLRNRDYMNTSPQMIIALLRQLRDEADVDESHITVGDTLCYFPNEYYELIRKEFPKVRCLDYVGQFGRTRAQRSSVPLYWSTPDAAGKETDYVPTSYVEADYLINMANLKSHNDYAGITLCAKNHYGSLVRRPPSRGYFDMHKDLPFVRPGMGHYRPLVDLMGHKHLGRKTLLYVIDGLYAGKHAKERAPRKWNMAPFDGDWTSSLFVSQDAVAIDAVGYDFLSAEWDDAPHRPGTNDYLVEAALADHPPSGAFYDPNHSGNVTRLASLGVYEHWNDPNRKQYSRNLGSGEGIELVAIGPALHTASAGHVGPR